VLAAIVLRSIFIAFAKTSGPTQLALMIAIELGLVLSHFVLKPSWTRGSHVFATYLAVTRLVCATLMIAFVEAVQVMAIPRVVIGIVIALIWSVSVLVVFGNIVWNIILSIRRSPKTVLSPDSLPTSSKESMVEKGHDSSVPSQENHQTVSDGGNSYPRSLDHDGKTQPASNPRPTNPTPDHNIPLDPATIQPYTSSPTETNISDTNPPSTSRSSETFGIELSSRWTISNSQPTSPVSSSQGHSAGQGGRDSGASSYNLTPSTPSETGSHHAGGAISNLSRNPSLRVQQRYEDIEEENEDN
jgi:hypothetical protein